MGFSALADQLTAKDTPSSIVSLGGTLTHGDWFMAGDVGQRKTRSFIADVRSWYLITGMRFGLFVSHITVAGSKTTDHNFSDTLQEGAGLEPIKQALATVKRYQSFDEQTVSLGVRTDISRSAAVKVQVDHVKPNGGGFGSLGVSSPQTFTGESTNVYKVSTEVVF